MRLIRPLAVAVIVTSGVALACSSEKVTDPVACPDVLRPSVIVDVRDNFGKAAAIGATLKLIGANDVINAGGPAVGYADSLKIFAGGNSIAGPMDVQLSKPWHNTVSVRGLRMTVGPCGVLNPAQITFTLRMLANAPPVRQVVAEPHARSYGAALITDKANAIVLADAGLSPEVTWTSRDESVVRITSNGVLTTQCRRAPGTSWIIASSVADPTVRDSISVSVAIDTNTSRCPGG